ncbi:hypothetical protein ACIRPX_29570 [Streptomyces sp. NPDC101225]|uniref:hypothetical protein n=1 Tax=Streptomyces sp. NPDC101225 TaxID=3366135 RepID=UPI0038042B36
MGAADRYEELRAAVFEGRGAGWRHGWAVLVRSGMAAWSKAVAALVPPPRATDEMPVQAVAVEGEAADQLVHVLAGLVLGRLQPP